MLSYTYMIKSHLDIQAYQRAKKCYPLVVALMKDVPPHGWHLRDQVCRSANSIQAQIAEGFGRSVAEFKMYLTRALGSNNETLSHLEDAINIGVIDQDKAKKLIEEYTIIGKQIYNLRETWE